MVKQILQAGSLFTLGRIVNIASQFVFSALLVRVLPKQEVADFLLSFSFVSFFSLLVAFGGENIVIKRFSDVINSKVDLSAKELLNAVLFSNFLIAFVVLLVVFFLCNLGAARIVNIDYSLSQVFILFCWFWSLSLQMILAEVFRAFARFSLTILAAGLFINSFNLLLISYFYVSIADLSSGDLFIYISISSSFLSVYLIVKATLTCSKFDAANHPRRQLKLLSLSRQIICDSAPSFLNKLGIQLMILADIWMVSAYFSKSSVAEYAIATKLAVSLSVFLSIANGFVPTFIGRLEKLGKMEVERFLRLIASLVALPTLGLFLLLFCLPEFIINLVYSESYAQAASFLSILLLAQVADVLVGACGYVLVMRGENVLLMRISISCSMLAIISAFVSLYYGAGVFSIAWSFTMASILRNIATYIAARKICGINTAVYFNPLLLVRNFKILLSKHVVV